MRKSILYLVAALIYFLSLEQNSFAAPSAPSGLHIGTPNPVVATATATPNPTATLGATPTVSPSGKMVPDNATQIIDTDFGIWTFGSSLGSGNFTILLNGTQAGNGGGAHLFWNGANVFALTAQNTWWRWRGPDRAWIQVNEAPSNFLSLALGHPKS